jgi:molybdopterin/thiamine biosynthesis adenylyltransferase
MTIHIVGCGALGSNIVEELAKNFYVRNQYVHIVLHDYDKVDSSRNIACQNFVPSDNEEYKSVSLARKLQSYDEYVLITPKTDKITKENSYSALGYSEDPEPTIIIDCVDNLETRLLLWDASYELDIPVIHSGIDPSGRGLVSWTRGSTDQFHLSPQNVSPVVLNELKKNPPATELPPCELLRMRSLVLNTSVATCVSIMLYMGHDILNIIPEFLDGDTGLMLGFNTSQTTIEPNLNSIGVDQEVLC